MLEFYFSQSAEIQSTVRDAVARQMEYLLNLPSSDALSDDEKRKRDERLEELSIERLSRTKYPGRFTDEEARWLVDAAQYNYMK